MIAITTDGRDEDGPRLVGEVLGGPVPSVA